MKRSVLIRTEEIINNVMQFADELESTYLNDKTDIIFISILKGSIFFFTDLLRCIKRDDIALDFLQVSSYGNAKQSTGKIELLHEPTLDVNNKHIVIVEDIIDSGYTVEFLYNYFKERNVKSFMVCSLLNKPSKRKVNLDNILIKSIFNIEDKFVCGYGLDFGQIERNVPYIYEYIEEDED